MRIKIHNVKKTFLLNWVIPMTKFASKLAAHLHKLIYSNKYEHQKVKLRRIKYICIAILFCNSFNFIVHQQRTNGNYNW